MNMTKESQTMYTISEAEKVQIQTLFNRKNGIRELMDSAVDNQKLYEKLRDDFIDLSNQFNQWFIDFETKNKTQGAPDHFWNVDFFNNTVVLQKINN